MAKTWTFWPCGCAMFQHGWMMCETCMTTEIREDGTKLTYCIPGRLWDPEKGTR